MFFSLDNSLLRLLPVVEVVFYMLSYGLGVGTIPWLLLGELCPARVKGVSSGLAVFVAYLTIFLVVKLFPWLTAAAGRAVTYWIFAVVCALTGLFTVGCLPETKGKSLGEIQDMFADKKEREEQPK